MKRKLFASILLASGLAAYGPSAQALDEVGGAVLGAGTGAVVGHMLGGRDAAIFGGFLGAILGAAAADDDDERVVVRRPPAHRPGPHGVVVVESPGPRPLPPPAWSAPRRGDEFRRHGRWHNRCDWRDDRRDWWDDDDRAGPGRRDGRGW